MHLLPKTSMIKRTGPTAARLQALPYEKRVCRIEHYPACLAYVASGSDALRGDNPAGASMEEEINAIADAGTQVWSVACERDRGTPLWPSKILPPAPDLNPEVMPKFLELAHAKGLIILTYYPFTFTKPLINLHPDWMIQMLDDGKPEIRNEGWCCWNSPYRDWLPELLNELLDTLDVDGIYFDDMNSGSHSDEGQRLTAGCRCTYCQALYKVETGRELPTKVDFSSVPFKEYVNWRYDKFCDAVAHVTRQIKARHPAAIIDFNYYGRPYISPAVGWETAHPLNPMELGCNFFIEAGLDNMGSNFPAKLGQAHGSSFGYWLWAPQILPEAASHSAPYPEPLTAQIFGLTAVAHGGASLTTCLEAGEHSIYGDALKSVFSEVTKLRDYVGPETVKYLAFHVSQQTRDFGYTAPDDYWQLLRGSHEMLNRSQTLMDFVFDQQLNFDYLSLYKVLFLSNSACLSAAQAAAVRQFVAQGGTLIATHETSLYDALGRRQGNFQLADVLGVEYISPVQGPPAAPLTEIEEMVQKKRFGRIVNNDEAVIYVPQGQELRDKFGHMVSFGARQSTVHLREGTNQPVVLYTQSSLKWGANPPLNIFHSSVPYDAGIPAVTLNAFGQGQAIYISGDVGSGYNRNPLPQLRRFVSHLVHLTPASIEVTAPGVIEVTATRHASGEIAIHLLNNSLPFLPWSVPAAERRTFYYAREIVPVHNARIHFEGARVKRAWLPFSQQELDVMAEPGTLVVPEVGLHTVVLVETE